MNRQRLHGVPCFFYRYSTVLLGLAICCISLVYAAAGPLIGEGALWRYYRGISSNPPDQNGSWTQVGYNDGINWSGFSPSGFGYGDCDDATEISGMADTHVSLYTRTTFVISNPAQITRLTLAVDYDDGFVAYLNGTEVQRGNMPVGTVNYNTLAAGNHESSRGNGSAPPQEKEFHTLNPALLVTGTNVLAVSGHNVSLGSSDFSLMVELYTNVSLVRGPFIQMPESDKVTVVWHTAALTDSVVEYGLDTSYGGGTVSNGALTRIHEISISGLLPGTTYYYRVRSGGEILTAGDTFRTRADLDQPFHFAVIGDFGQGTPEMQSIADRINARNDWDLFLTVGDNVYGTLPCPLEGAPGWYDPYFFSLYEPTMRRVATFPCLGNHDDDTASGQWMVDYFRAPTNGPPGEIGKNYSFEFGNAHFIVINTEPVDENDAGIIEATRVWLSNDLAQATAPWKVAFLHRPPYTSASSHGDNELVKQHLAPILEAAGVQMVFQGHNHFYERLNAINGVYYITTGSGGGGLYTVTERKPYSAALVDTEHSYTDVQVDGPSLTVRQFNTSDVQIDEFNLDISHPFAIDGLLDSTAWQRASNGLNLHAAIRGNVLYVATQDAGEGSDHFLYLAGSVGSQVAANWGKAGTIMQWKAFLADENDGGFQRWFDASQGLLNDVTHYRSMTSGLNNNDPVGNGVMEGTVDLPHLFGAFPQQLYLAAAPYATEDGGALVSVAQVPAGNNDGDLQANEFLLLNTRDIALDLPMASAGPDQQVEAGMWAILDGSASTSPAGFALSYAWAQASGPLVTATNLDQSVAAVVSATNVPAPTNVVFRLRVNDSRFDSDDDLVTITVIPMVDTDGDGLSDQEALTGYNNILTAFDPQGHITSPNQADTDNDGVPDGEEIYAGTDPNQMASRFEMVTASVNPEGERWLQWNTVSGRVYHLQAASNAVAGDWAMNQTFLATSAVSWIHDTNAPSDLLYYRVRVLADE